MRQGHLSAAEKSAEALYQTARSRWAQAIYLSVYDDQDVIHPVAAILRRALRLNPEHVGSLALLGDLLMELEDDEAREVLAKLHQLQPSVASHQQKLAMLEKEPSALRRDEIRDFLEGMWIGSRDRSYSPPREPDECPKPVVPADKGRMPPDRITIFIATRVAFGERSGSARLADALESLGEFLPTHWGENERAARPYSRDAFLDGVRLLATRSDSSFAGLKRRRQPRYEGHISARSHGVNYVSIDFLHGISHRLVPRVFGLGDALATHLEAEFGFVHPMWIGVGLSSYYGASGTLNLNELQTYGPHALCARTWVGPHFLRLIGQDRLRGCGAVVKDLSWGGMQVDLFQDPWERGGAELAAQQAEVMKRLEPSGVFGDYSVFLDYKRGPNFVPLYEGDAR